MEPEFRQGSPDVGANPLDDLARLLGVPVGDWSDEVTAGNVYYSAIPRTELHGLLRHAVRVELDRSLAESVVIGALEYCSTDDAAEWIALLGADSRRLEYAERRAREVATLRAIAVPEASDAAPDVTEWTDWLQRRAVASASNRSLLVRLAEAGRTRRVRAAARERLRELA